jgi:hypothetical protein
MSIFSFRETNERWNSYLFDYSHDGQSWSFEIPARSEREARERVNSLSNAQYLGEIKMTIPGHYGLLAQLVCWTRNFFSKKPTK